jgi:hypothetical protein
MQKISYNGDVQWDVNGIQVAEDNHPQNIEYYSIQTATDEQVAIFYTWYSFPFSDNYIHKGMLFDGDGNSIWQNQPIDFATHSGYKAGLTSTKMVTYANQQYWITLWADSREHGFDNAPLFLQRINLDGTLGGSSCSKPINMKVSEIGITSAKISWESYQSNLSWNIRYRDVLDTTWTIINTLQENYYLLEQLTPNTSYLWSVQANCENDTNSEWANGESFLTANICFSPINLEASEIGITSAKLSWESDPSNLSWNVRYRDALDTTWTTIDVLKENYYLLEQLIPNTSYLWSVQANCENDANSEWANGKSFSTMPMANNEFNSNKMVVSASGKIINIINPDKTFIEHVQVYSTSGVLLSDYIIKSTDNVFIMTALNQSVVIVKVYGKNITTSFKVWIQ